MLARSALADETRKRRRYFSFLDRFTRQAIVELDSASNVRAEEQLKTLLENQVAALPPEEQELIEQKYFARRSIREIAEGLQTSAAARHK